MSERECERAKRTWHGEMACEGGQIKRKMLIVKSLNDCFMIGIRSQMRLIFLQRMVLIAFYWLMIYTERRIRTLCWHTKFPFDSSMCLYYNLSTFTIYSLSFPLPSNRFPLLIHFCVHFSSIPSHFLCVCKCFLCPSRDIN